MNNSLANREPEPHLTATVTKSDYCAMDDGRHTKCLYSSPNPGCSILDRGLKYVMSVTFVEKINE